MEPSPIHRSILEAAQRLAAGSEWRFRITEIVAALPHENPATVRTQVSSYCCVNAPRNHAHRRPYFRRVRQGVYEIEPAFRISPVAVVEETPAAWPANPDTGEPARESIHAVVRENGHRFAAECLGLPVIAQGRTLDATIQSLRDAIRGHLVGSPTVAAAYADSPRLCVHVETTLLPTRSPSLDDLPPPDLESIRHAAARDPGLRD